MTRLSRSTTAAGSLPKVIRNPHQSYREKGLVFEKLTLEKLENFGFKLTSSSSFKMVGDGGIDLSGTWKLIPDNNIVLVQCKNLSESVPVSDLREFESSIRKVEDLRQVKTFGIFATSSRFSSQARTWFFQSNCNLSAVIINQGPFQFFMNASARRQFPHIRVIRQYNPIFASYSDVIVSTKSMEEILPIE